MGQQVAHGVYPTALPGGVQQLGDGGFQPFMCIGDCQLDTAQTAPGQGPQELGPERFCLGSANRHPQYFAATVVVNADGDDHRD